MRSFLQARPLSFLFTTFIDFPDGGSRPDRRRYRLGERLVRRGAVRRDGRRDDRRPFGGDCDYRSRGALPHRARAATLHQLRVRMKGFADEAFDIRTASGDASYESVLGYPALPRSVVAGVRFDIAAGR